MFEIGVRREPAMGNRDGNSDRLKDLAGQEIEGWG